MAAPVIPIIFILWALYKHFFGSDRPVRLPEEKRHLPSWFSRLGEVYDPGIFLVVMRLLAVLVVAWLPVEILGGKWELGLLWFPCFAYGFPSTFTGLVLRPLRLTRVTWFLAKTDFLKWRLDIHGGAALEALRTEMNHREHPQERLDRLEMTIRSGRWPRRADREYVSVFCHLSEDSKIRGAAVAALGLLAECRGDRAVARQWMEAVLLLPASVTPSAARRLALEWLAFEAAEEGDWDRLDFLASRRPRTAATAFVAGLSKRFRGHPRRPWKIGLCWSWLLARNRLKSLPLLRKGLRFNPARRVAAAKPAGTASPPRSRHPLDEARGALVGLLRTRLEDLTASQVGQAAAAWDKALGDPRLETWVTKRALELSAARPDKVAEGLSEDLCELLAGLVMEAEVPLHEIQPRGCFLEQVELEVQDRLLSPVEESVAALDARLDESRFLPAPEEFLEAALIMALYERAVDVLGEGARRYLYPELSIHLTRLGVNLFNVRAQHTLANTLFRWLLNEAVILDVTEDIDLFRRNIRCGS